MKPLFEKLAFITFRVGVTCDNTMKPKPQPTPSRITRRVGVTCDNVTGLFTQLDLNTRTLGGVLPEGWSVLTDLTSLAVYGNGIAGTVPDAWSTLVNLSVSLI